MLEEYHVNYTFVFRKNVCYHCVKLIVRTVNVLEKLEGKRILKISYRRYILFTIELSILASCVNLPTGVEPTVENVCKGLRPDQQLITLFSENYVPVNCRSSLEGVWQFAYQASIPR